MPRDSSRQESRQSPSSRRQDSFSFRNRDDAPQYPREHDTYRPGPEQLSLRRRRKFQTRPKHGPNVRGYRVATANRPLLSTRQDVEPEQMFGISDELSGSRRFISADDITDSEEELMEESDDDLDEGGGVNLITPSADTILDGTKGQNIEPPAKKRALMVKRPGFESDRNLHRWSNPDPYTALPPIDDSQRKRKDVVKIIRRARVVTDKGAIQGAVAQSQVAANDDFISFGFEDEPSNTDEDSSSSPAPTDSRPRGPGVPGVPSGPRQFSHRNNLRDQSFQRAPGSQILPMSADVMGPPPGLAPQTRANCPIVKSDPKPSRAVFDSRKNNLDYMENNRSFPPLKRKRADRTWSTGSLVDDWVPYADIDRTPWLGDESNHRSENQGFRLHKEICDFYEFVRPQRYEQTVREDLLQRLQTVVGRELSCNIHSFGSFAAGLYLPNADMDLVVISDDFSKYRRRAVCQSTQSMRKFAWYLKETHIAEEGSVEIIPNAKVPLIKFRDRLTSIKVDMSFENSTGLAANETFISWKLQYPAMPILVTLIKQFLMMRGLNEVVNGGLGGFSVTCLVTSLLQNMPRVQTGDLVPEHHLGELLIEFLDFYGNQFDISRTGIQMSPPGYFDKYDFHNSSNQKRLKPDRLAIMDPNRPGNDISGGSGNVMLIFDCFSEAHQRILEAMKTPNHRSLLEWSLGGNYEIFLWQRDHLQKIHKEHCGSPELGPVDNGDCNDLQQQISVNVHPPSDNQQASLHPSFHMAGPTLNLSVNIRDMEIHKPVPTIFRATGRKSAQKTKETELKIPPSKIRKKEAQNKMPLSTAEKNKARALRLKRQYPDIEVPDKISKTARANLLRQIPQSKKPTRKAARRGEVAKNLEGLSINNPVQLD